MKQVGFIGAGSIAEAMIKGVIQNQLLQPEDIWVTNAANQARLLGLQTKYDVNITSPGDLSFVEHADVIVLAFKPKDIMNGLERLKPFNLKGKCIVSVIAGVPTRLIEDTLNEAELSVIRTMPNTSCAVGESATAITPGRWVKNQDLINIRRLFEAVGIVEEVEESHMDAITGLSGSGPAYVYYMIEALVEAGVKTGLEKEIVQRLVYQTVVGAARMLQEAEEDPAALREHITSPAGTTAAGIAVLAERNFPQAIVDAVCKATDRAHELGLVYQSELSD
ncbi:pyrroline-5-carboxylate reductase [Fodinisporobacter ferrooxydans]|uniref:Pyrroline-5-carboxylate reductase n=1 Tax=Fodinisporobacter ferrooxydans TaxID=2901836 RepID=A0ABY4CIJ2_9BACL|nr:pyrroline-5-carboxylate reductase [Alicyclobacillaceae bacterium MYW30-H2]